MINRLSLWITKHPKSVIFIAVLLLIPSIIGFLYTPVNYDILSYLPEELDSVKGINILDKDFNEASMGIVVLKDMEWDDIKTLENQVSEIEAVKTVLWLGALSESPIPLSMFPDGISSMLYSEDKSSTLMMIQFNTPGSSEPTLDAIGQITELLPAQCKISGTAAMTYDLKVILTEQTPIYAAVGISLALLALALTMESFMLPIVMLLALGISIIYNMGTNILFGEISFITQAIAAILQLGVTMDYSIFLMDRYVEEKPKYRTREAAMATAIRQTFVSLAGSSLTTVFGFLALCFMSFTLGLDLGIVMAKGIIFGILTVITILPALLLVFENAIYKTRHRSLVPSFGGMNKLTIKLRKVIAIIFVALLVPVWIAQNNVEKYYNMMDAMPESMNSIAAMNSLKEDFNMASMNMVLIDEKLPDTDKIEISERLAELDGVSAVLGLNSMMGTALDASVIPDSTKSMLMANGKELLVVNSIYTPASDECNAQVEQINKIIKEYDKDAYVTGEAPMYKDLIEVTDRDFIITNIISIAAIFVLIAIIFKSISIPVILVVSIEFAIWINLAISYLMGESICFVAPTIISCVQLGATVDYAILLTTRFREELQNGKEKKEAMKIAADSSHKSIFQSALVFFAATFGVYLICDIDIVRSICMMLARGAFISALVIMLFLTPVLVVCEGFINKTTFRWRIKKVSKSAEISDEYFEDDDDDYDDEEDDDDEDEDIGEQTQIPSVQLFPEKFTPPAPAPKQPPIEYKEISSHTIPTAFIPAKTPGRTIQHGNKKIAKVPKTNTDVAPSAEPVSPAVSDEETSKLIDEIIASVLEGDNKE